MAGRMVEVKCQECKELFLARVADRKRGWAKFCSKKCKAVKQVKKYGDGYKYAKPQDEKDHEYAMDSREDGWQGHKDTF